MRLPRRISPDSIAIGVLIALWLLFFWRLWTPVTVDRTMLVEGDFSGQFVTFAAYQYERLTSGEIPLWNPYNNGGLPFVADTQTAAFYPPRLMTIALTRLLGDFSYETLQYEMMVHVLVLTLLMYLFVRRLTLGNDGSVCGAFVSAVIVGYGGFISGYPPLQLALLNAAVWLPLALVGILESTRSKRIDWIWLSVSGLALGLTWMAGHPQTGLYATYFAVAYLGYRSFVQRHGWLSFVLGLIVMGLITFGLVAVQFIPGIEYTFLSMRSGLSFDQKSNGFPYQDVVQFVFPDVVSVWSPLFVGVTGLVLAVLAGVRRVPGGMFWIGSLFVALALSVGGNSVIYHLVYNILPGMGFFRGQERAAYLVTINLSVLAGLGTVIWYSLKRQQDVRFVRRFIAGIAALLLAGSLLTLFAFLLWFDQSELYSSALSPMFFSVLMLGGLLMIAYRSFFGEESRFWRYALVGLVVFELFSVNMDNSNFESYRADLLQPQAYIREILSDGSDDPFRIDGNLYGLLGNFASIHEVMDIRGISPLFLDGPHAIIQRELPSEVAWELFAVKYVLSGGPDIPADAELLRTDQLGENVVNLFRLSDPRPYALLQFDYEVLDSDEFARALLADPNYIERDSIILAEPPPFDMPDIIPTEYSAEVTEYAPERVVVEIETPENALLSLAHVDYPGWNARLNGQAVDRSRAYGALIAVPVPAGNHILTLTFEPWSVTVGAVISGITWFLLSFVLMIYLLMSFRGANANRSETE